MEYSRYLDLILADSNALLAAVQVDSGAAVPSCPGWTAADLLRHVGEVYQHKVLCMSLGREPSSAERDSAPEPGTASYAWFLRQRDALLEQLTQRGPEQQSFTWFPPDRSVGFWFRRMAAETAVHRVDAELATGTRTPIDPELATDGVDELVGFLTYDFGDSAIVADGAGRTVQLRTDDCRWALALRTDGVDLAPEDTAPDAGIHAAPQDLLLYLWNRDRDNTVVDSWGDPSALAGFATRIGEETG